MVLVAALYTVHALLVRYTGQGLGAAWLLALILPGALAAHLCERRGMQSASAREGAQAGLLTAHFAAALLIVALLVAIFTVDWQAYGQLVGPDIAGAVRSAIVPAAVIGVLAAAAVAYGGCVLAGWLGAEAYVAARSATKRLR